MVDAVPVLPGLLDNAISRQLRDFYVSTYRDKFFEGQVPAWFTSYTWMEILYHVPLSAWALSALSRGMLHPVILHNGQPTRKLRPPNGSPGSVDTSSRLPVPASKATADPSFLKDDPLVPVHLLVFGLQSFLTSWTCLCEVWAWEDRTLAEKQSLSMLYGPYVALGMLCPTFPG